MTALLAWFLALSLNADTGTTYHFQSKDDSFDLKVAGDKAKIGDKDARGEIVAWFQSLLKEPTDGSCPPMKNPADLTVTFEEKGVKRTRGFYRVDRLMTENEACAVLAGRSVYGLPMHKDFFLTPAARSVPLGDKAEIAMDSSKLHFAKTKGGGWELKDLNLLPNQVFVTKFFEGLSDFEVSGLVHPEAAGFGAKFKLMSNGKTYEFSQVDENLWGVKVPGEKWLVVSKTWNPWSTSLISQFQSPGGDAFSQVINKKLDTPARIKAAQKLAQAPSEALSLRLVSVLADEKEDTELRQKLAEIYINSPSKDSLRAMVRLLGFTNDKDLRRYLSSRLQQTQNKKGPVIETDDDVASVTSKRKAWREWMDSKP